MTPFNMLANASFVSPVMTTGRSPICCRAGSTTPRRIFLLQLASVVLPAIVPQKSSAAPATSIANSILSAYGLPTLRDVSGFTALLEQYENLVVEFQYPTAWIVQRNVQPLSDGVGLMQYNSQQFQRRDPMTGRASGLTAGDYRKAEGLSFYVGLIDNKKEVDGKWIADLVTPGDATGDGSNVRVIREWKDEKGANWIETKWESITASGYSVERRARTKVVMLGDERVYALSGFCTSNRWKKVGDLLMVSLESFEVYKV